MKKIIFMILAFVTFIPIFAQDGFDIKEFSNPEKYGWKTNALRLDYREDLIERQKLLQIFKMKKQNKIYNMTKSAVLPGWGHFSAENYTKGQVLLGLEIVSLSTAFYFYDKTMENYKRYKDATQIGEMNQRYNDARNPFRYAQAFFGLSALIWVYSIYDTYLVTEEFNADLWDNIYKEYNQKNFRITPFGVSWRF